MAPYDILITAFSESVNERVTCLPCLAWDDHFTPLAAALVIMDIRCMLGENFPDPCTVVAIGKSVEDLIPFTYFGAIVRWIYSHSLLMNILSLYIADKKEDDKK